MLTIRELDWFCLCHGCEVHWKYIPEKHIHIITEIVQEDLS